MSVRIMSDVWDLKLPPGQKLVLLKLADCADDVGANAFPSVGALADSCSMGRRTVQRTLAELQAAGYLLVQAQAIGRRPTVYQVNARGAKMTPRQNDGASSATARGANDDAQGAPSATHSTDPSSTDPSGSISTEVVLGRATPEQVVRVWNATITKPFAQVRPPLAADRLARLARACQVVVDLEDWRRLFAWMNGQRWMRAPGTGEHPTWVASLDWLTRKPGTVQAYVERARSHVAPVPRTVAAVRAATRESGVAATGAEDFDLIGPEAACR